MVNLEATKSELQVDKRVCRLCLKNADCVNIFEEQLDGIINKSSLAERLSDFFQIKYERTSALPNSICQYCLHMVETFSTFHHNVKKCESELKKRVAQSETQESQSGKAEQAEMRSGLNGCPGIFDPEGDCIITVVDPLQEDESSDDDFSMDSDSEMEDSPSISDRKKRSLADENNVSEMPMPHAGDHISVENSSRTEVTTYTVPALESLAMEFTKNTFLCQFCDMAFTTHQECADHESRHDPINPFNCKFCALNTSTRQNLIYHIKEMHDNERPYVCVICNKGFCRRSDLKKHTIVHTGVRPFTCPVCAKSFSRNTNLTKHMRIHSGIKPHVCQKCPRSFTTAGELIRHARSHSEVKPYQCGKCSASFTRKDKLLLHNQTHYRTQTDLTLNQPKVMTSMVVKDLSSPSKVEDIVVPLNPYSNVGSEHDLNYLPQLESSDKRICHTSHISEPSRQISSQLHISGKKDLYKRSILAAQLQIARTPKNTFGASSDKVKVLSKNHRIIACDICEKNFTRERDLQRHQALHLDKLFTCKACGRGFNRREKLLRHEHEQHRPQYTCSLCHMKFSKPEALNLHMKVHELRHNMDITQMVLGAATSGSSVDAKSVGVEMMNSTAATTSDITFYNQMVPTMNLGFYSEIRPEDRNGG